MTHHNEHKGRARCRRRTRLLSLTDNPSRFHPLTSMQEVCECNPVFALNFSVISCFLIYLAVFFELLWRKRNNCDVRIMKLQPVNLIFVDYLLSPTVAVPEQRDKMSPYLSNTTELSHKLLLCSISTNGTVFGNHLISKRLLKRCNGPLIYVDQK